MFSNKHADVSTGGNTKGKRICMVITWLLAPTPTLQCSLPVVSLSDSRRQKGHDPWCGFGKLVHSFYHQGQSLSGDVQSGSACMENSFPTLTLAVKRWPQGEAYNVNHFEDGCCCVKMFAVQPLPDSNGNPVRASFNSLALVQNTYRYCAGI